MKQTVRHLAQLWETLLAQRLDPQSGTQTVLPLVPQSAWQMGPRLVQLLAPLGQRWVKHWGTQLVLPLVQRSAMH